MLTGVKEMQLLILRPRLFQFKRGFAEAAVAANNTLKLSFACPHITFHDKKEVAQVNLSGEEGDMGILAGHAPTLIQLRPGVLSIKPTANSTELENYFVAGGFATINPESELHVAAMEAVPLDHLDPEAVQKGLAEATAYVAQNANSSDSRERAISQIGLQVYQALNEAVKKQTK